MTVKHEHECEVCDRPYACDGDVDHDDESGSARCFAPDRICPACVKAHSDEFEALSGPDGFRS